jgi:sugar phosphate isomerase/epimerase
MKPFKIGVLSDGFRLGPQDGVRQAAALGAEGVQVYTVAGQMSPEELDAAGRRAFKQLCADEGIAISALCGDLGGGFADAAQNPAHIERSKRIVDLAVDLGTNVVSTHIGLVPDDRQHADWAVMLDACREIAEYGAGAGVTFAVETGPEPAALLKRFLDEVGSRGLGVNLDPANLVMVAGDDPVQAVHTLSDYIVHTHAKDGVQTRAGSVAALFGRDAEATPVAYQEMPLGEGDVDWDRYLDALEQIGYNGFLTVEREVGDDPAADIGAAIDFLRGKIG